MRKIILAALAAVTIAVVGGYNYYYLNSGEVQDNTSIAETHSLMEVPEKK